MAEDRIDNYVDRTGFASDTEFVLGQLNTIYEAFKKLDSVKVSLGKSSGLGELIPLVKQANEELKTITDSQNKLAESTKKVNVENEKYPVNQGKMTDSLKDNIRQQNEYKNKLTELSTQLKKLRKDQEIFGDAPGNEAAKAAIDERIQALSEEEVQLKAISREIGKIINIQVKATQSLPDTTGELKTELAGLEALRDRTDKSSDEFLKLQGRIKTVRDELHKIEQDGSDFKRNVGNYGNSLATGFQKVQDEIKRLVDRNEQLKSSFKDLSGGRTTIKGFGQGNDFGGDTNAQAQLQSLTNEYKKNEDALNSLIQAQQVGFKVGTNATQQVKDLQNAYRSLALSNNQSEVFLEEFLKEVGNAKDAVSDLNERINLAASDTQSLDVLIGGAQAVAGAFGIAQGAAALFGDESEDVQKTLVKLNGVMTVLNGLQSIQNELKKKDNIVTIAQVKIQAAYNFVLKQTAILFGTGATAAQRFRAAMTLTGIGALITIIGLLVTNIDKLSNAFSPAVREAEKLEEITRKQYDASLLAVEGFDLEERKLKALGVAEDEIREKKRLRIKQTLQAADAELKALDAVLGAVVESSAKGAAAAAGNPLLGLFFKDIDDIKKVQDTVKEIKAKREELEVELLELNKADSDDKKKQQDDANKKAEEAGKKRKEIANRNAKAEFEIEKTKLERTIKAQEEILNDQKESLKTRLLALIAFTEASKKLIDLENKYETTQEGLTAKEIELINEKKYDKVVELQKNTAEKLAIIRGDLAAAEKRFAERTIGSRTTPDTGEGIKKIEDQLKEAHEVELDLINQKREAYKNLYNEVANAISAIVGGIFDAEKNKVQEQITKVEELKAAEIERVNQQKVNADGTVITEEQKAARISIIEARTQSEREALERKQKKIDRDKAIFDKAFRAFQITAAGIESIAKIKLAIVELTAKAAANPFLLPLIPLAAAQIPISIATTAAQLAAIAATPIPKFRGGKNLNKAQVNDAYEGPSIVGDGYKKEAIIRENGNVEITPATPTLTYLKSNDIVIPDANMITDRVIAKSQSQMMSVNVNGELEVKEKQSNQELKSEIRGMKNEVVSAIKNKKEFHFETPGPMRNVERFKDGNKEYFKMNGL